MRRRILTAAISLLASAGLVVGVSAPAQAGGGLFTTYSSCMAWYKAAQEAGDIAYVIKLCVKTPVGYELHYWDA